MIGCLWCYQYPGRRFSSNPFGGDNFFLLPIEREGVTGMVTWGEFFQFCMVILAVIALIYQDNNKKR